MRSRLINAAVLCGSLLICLAGAEAMLRITNLSFPLGVQWIRTTSANLQSGFVYDPQTGWKMRPNNTFQWVREKITNDYRSNSQGFRSDRDFNPASPGFKMAFVGDSYTFGSGVAYEQTFASLLENQASGRVAWDFAMPGFGIDQAWLATRYQILPNHPDLLVVGIVDADFERSQISFRGVVKPVFRVVNGRLEEKKLSSPTRWQTYLYDNVRLWSMYMHAKQWMGRHYGIGEYWTLNQAILDTLREDCRKAGVPVLFLYIPTKEFRAFPALRQYMRRTGAEYIDLTEARSSPQGIYLPHDGHFNPAGHRYMAGLIEHWLEAHQFGSAATARAASH